MKESVNNTVAYAQRESWKKIAEQAKEPSYPIVLKKQTHNLSNLEHRLELR